MKNEYWMGKHFSYIVHRDCEFFPCHPGADPDNFNCLFCYCPLYIFGDRCGGNFVYLDNDVKDCSLCLFPHLRENYGKITSRYQEILQLMPQRRQNAAEDASAPAVGASETAEVLTRADRRLLTQIDECENVTKHQKSAVRKAVSYIHEHIRETISLDDLAELVGLSRYYFSHAFKKITQLSPIQYIQFIRLEQAKLLLSSTDLPLEEIALQVGYQSGSTLSALFAKKLQITPGKYRRQMREKSKNADCISQSDDIQ